MLLISPVEHLHACVSHVCNILFNEQNTSSNVEVQPGEGADVPDIVMREITGPLRRVLFTVEIKTM